MILKSNFLGKDSIPQHKVNTKSWLAKPFSISSLTNHKIIPFSKNKRFSTFNDFAVLDYHSAASMLRKFEKVEIQEHH